MYIYVLLLFFPVSFCSVGPTPTHLSARGGSTTRLLPLATPPSLKQPSLGSPRGGGRVASPSIAVYLRGSEGAEGEELVFARWPQASLCVRGCRSPRSRGLKSDPGPSGQNSGAAGRKPPGPAHRRTFLASGRNSPLSSQRLAKLRSEK